jgi:hypothetical protein
MKSLVLRALVLSFSTVAVALLALSPSEAADSSSSSTASSDPMGACCGQQPPADASTDYTKPKDMICGTGTHLDKASNMCVSDRPLNERTPRGSSTSGGQQTLPNGQ